MTQFIAHRGLSARYPENTHLAFNAAWHAGCDGIELDIQVTKDLEVVVIHDPDTGRVMSNKKDLQSMIIAQNTYEDLLKTTVGANEKIPKLSDVLASMPENKIVQIEVKHQINNNHGLDSVVHFLGEMRRDIDVQIISFDPHKLNKIKQAHSELCCLLLVPEKQESEHDLAISDPIAFAQQHGFSGLGLAHVLVSPNYVAEIRQANLKIGAWTVNNIERAKTLAELKVDYIASDIADTIKNSSAP